MLSCQSQFPVLVNIMYVQEARSLTTRIVQQQQYSWNSKDTVVSLHYLFTPDGQIHVWRSTPFRYYLGFSIGSVV